MKAGWLRLGLLAALVIAGAAAVVVVKRQPAPAPDVQRLSWIADAHQLGPVGYRDPAGAVSPDGKWIAYSEGRFLRVRPAGGGPLVEFPPGEAQIRNIAWDPGSQRILADGFQTQTGWAVYDRITESRRGLWADHDPLRARPDGSSTTAPTAKVSDLRQLAWSRDGRTIAGIVNGRDGQELWTVSADGTSADARRMAHRIAFPAFTARGEIACVTTADGRSRVTVPCGGTPVIVDPDLDVYGPVAFAPDAATMYVSLANDSGTVDLWAAPVAGGRSRRLTAFSRDTYAPSVSDEGSLVFKVQSYRTAVAIAASDGGPSRPVAAFQSETPSWDPAGRRLGITYGTWRRVIDDAKYPDIAQDAGIIAIDLVKPPLTVSSVVHASASEDQALCWSPNGKWIAFHSHQDQSDDVWLRPAEGDAAPTRVSFLGRGAEVGWPRWSPDGKWLLFDGDSRATHRSVMFVAGIDQATGAVTRQPQEVAVRGIDADVSHAEWLADSARVIVIGKEAPGRHVIYTVPRDGGQARVVRRFASEHDTAGLAASPDGRDIAFVEASPDGFFQIFRMPVSGGRPVQVTTDRSHKTQPAWSPDGRRLAFTVWNYDAQFWRLK
jgi:Tol biopolymer transport system component